MSTSIQAIIRFALRHPKADFVKILLDVSLMTMAAGWAWFVSFGQVKHPGSPLPFLFAALFARMAIYLAMRLHRLPWIHVSRYDILQLVVSAALGPIAIALTLAALPPPFTLRALVRPGLILVTEPALYLLLLSGARITARALHSTHRRQGQARRILIVGAGAAGRALASHIQEEEPEYEIAGLIDDNVSQRGRRVRGLRILGTIAELPRLAHDLRVEEIVIAIPSLNPERLREILDICRTANLPVRLLPSLRELMSGHLKGGVVDTALRPVRMEDLLPRPEVKLDPHIVSRYLNGKSVLVTGGGGSIGGELCRQAVAAGAHCLLVLGRGENSVFEIVHELGELETSCKIIPVICDVRDRPALGRVFEHYAPQVVFHAAAHKHVPLMEQYCCEAVKNNVLGTLNVVELAIAHQAESFVMVSTDKAVEPYNVMGATKHLCERIVKGYAAHSNSNMVSVRFGNVLGSRGSVVPTMRRQIGRRLPITITDPDMARFFMTIPEAVQLILQAGAIGGRGEVFVLDMGRPVKILDLAYDLIRLSGLVPSQDIPIRIIGRRPGEKMHEDILTSLEAAGAKKNGPFYMATSRQVILPELLEQIEILRVASEDGDDARAMSIMQNLIPGFCPDLHPHSQNGNTRSVTCP